MLVFLKSWVALRHGSVSACKVRVDLPLQGAYGRVGWLTCRVYLWFVFWD